MHDARNKQISMYYGKGIIEQDAQLIEFVEQHEITQITVNQAQDLEYFSKYLPNVSIGTRFMTNPFLYVVIEKNPYLLWESFLDRLLSQTTRYRPKWLYVAVNQYVVTTQQTWPNLTDNYPGDLLDSLTATLCDYIELKRNDPVDLGQNFNFAHPTTHVYYQRATD